VPGRENLPGLQVHAINGSRPASFEMMWKNAVGVFAGNSPDVVCNVEVQGVRAIPAYIHLRSTVAQGLQEPGNFKRQLCLTGTDEQQDPK
jgi:hypothetical protein